MKNNNYIPKLDWKFIIITVIAAMSIGLMIMMGITYVTTNKLIKKVEEQEKAKQELSSQMIVEVESETTSEDLTI